MRTIHALTQEDYPQEQTEVETYEEKSAEPENLADLAESEMKRVLKTPEDDVLVISGACTESFPLAGRTVGEARSQLQKAMNIGPDAAALVDGTKVKPGHILQKNDVLEFVKEGGEKG